MTVLVVGSVAFDTIETPEDRRERILGGAANYFSVAAAHFCPVRLVAVVGDDFPQSHVEELSRRGIDMAGLERVTGGKTFHWAGRYEQDGNQRETLATDLNVFADFDPRLGDDYKLSKYVFLANIHPEIQLKVLDQVEAPEWVAADTMNLWIESTRDSLLKVLGRVDTLFVNEDEARMLAGEFNLVKAGRAVSAMGPSTVVVKLGAYGAMIFRGDELLYVPAYPLADVVDPTGAGDSFAGGFVGYVARMKSDSLQTLHRAAAVGSVCGSFACQGFGLERLLEIVPADVDQRLTELRHYADFDSSALFA